MRPAFATIALAIAFMGIVSGVGVASASASAVPGDALYNVKLGIEETRLAFSLCQKLRVMMMYNSHF